MCTFLLQPPDVTITPHFAQAYTVVFRIVKTDNSA